MSLEIFDNFFLAFPRQSGSLKSVKRSALGRVSEIKFMHQVNQPQEINRCNKNQCQQMCLLKPHGFACACRDGWELTRDNLTCAEMKIDEKGVLDERFQEQLRKECSCKNGGKCTKSALKMSDKEYYCKCPRGYHGSQCESGPSGSVVLTVVLICSFFIIVAGAGVFLMNLR